MIDIPHLVSMLKDENPNVRYLACEFLLAEEQQLPQEALDTLTIATNDLNGDVAAVARRALELHQLNLKPNQNVINTLNTSVKQIPFHEIIMEKITLIEERYLKKQNGHGGKFSRIGMLLTFFGASILAITVGLILYGIGTILEFHIPFLFPIITSLLIGVPIMWMGKEIGHCRNLSLAVSVPVLASVLVWLIEHFVGLVLFQSDNPTTFYTIKAGGAVLPILFTLNSFWSTIYWIIELLIIVVATGLMNVGYSFKPYCENCNAWHNFKVPVAGIDLKLKQAIKALETNDIPATIEALANEGDGNITRLEVEFCPKCYGDGVRLIVVHETGDNKWEEKIVWSGMLEPKYVQELIQYAR